VTKARKTTDEGGRDRRKKKEKSTWGRALSLVIRRKGPPRRLKKVLSRKGVGESEGIGRNREKKPSSNNSRESLKKRGGEGLNIVGELHPPAGSKWGVGKNQLKEEPGDDLWGVRIETLEERQGSAEYLQALRGPILRR